MTVLFSRTLPLIPYEMSDRVALGAGLCPCGRTFGLLAAVEGRREDILEVPASVGGSVSIHHNAFHAALERAPVAAWQVVQRPTEIAILVERPDPSLDRDALGARVAAELSRQGAAPMRVVVEAVDAIPRGTLGKAPLVRREA